MKNEQSFLRWMKTSPKMSVRAIIVLAWLAAFSMGVAACKSTPAPVMTTTPRVVAPTSAFVGTPVPFETIESAEEPRTGELYDGKEPRVVILTSTGAIDQLGKTISEQAHQELQGVDFNDYIVVIVFQGWKPSDRYSVQVLQVTRIDDRLAVYAEFIEPSPDSEVFAWETSPYQLIRIRKEGIVGRVNFVLIVNDNVIQQTEVSISQ